jgi:hypothetical protein
MGLFCENARLDDHLAAIRQSDRFSESLWFHWFEFVRTFIDDSYVYILSVALFYI